jgi:PqqD family protein of HPr-rel-A system
MTAPIRPRAREDLATVELDGEVVIYDEASGDLHHLNPTATLVFSMCDGTATIAELAADIGEVFDVPTSDVERQVRSLLRQLRRQRLLEATPPSGDHAARNGNGQVAARG